jgi:hypothetical protein
MRFSPQKQASVQAGLEATPSTKMRKRLLTLAAMASAILAAARFQSVPVLPVPHVAAYGSFCACVCVWWRVCVCVCVCVRDQFGRR